MFRTLSRFFDTSEIPYGARVITNLTAVFWFGWGFAETLIPIFLFSFGHSYSGAGFLRASYDVAFIIAMPLVGLFADKVRATSLLLVGLVLYVLIGGSYFVAGATGMVFFVILARVLHGTSFALTSVGRDIFFRRHSPAEKLGSVFGYFDTVATFWWIAAAVIGIWAVRLIPIHGLLLLITPASMIAIGMLIQFRRDKNRNPVGQHFGTGKLRELWVELRGWDASLRTIAVVNFCMTFAYTILIFFVPIEIYSETASYTLAILSGIATGIPMVFGFILGKWFERSAKKIFLGSIFVFALLTASLAVYVQPWWQVIVMLGIGFAFETVSIGWRSLVTVHADPARFGVLDGLLKSIANLGSLVGPLLAGLSFDRFGLEPTYAVLAGMLVLLLPIARTLFSRK